MRTIAVVCLTCVLASAALGQSREYNGPSRRAVAATELTDEIIVQWQSRSAASGMTRMQKLGSLTGRQLQRKLQIAPDMDVLSLDRPLTDDELGAALTAMTADPNVVYAVPNRRKYAHAAPVDPLFSQQWYFLDTQPAATRSIHAWDVTTGSSATVVAVIDTGVRFEHPDLGPAQQGGKLLPGFDFVSHVSMANDGDGFDADASDPGDWVSASDAQQSPFNDWDCIPDGRTSVDSSWHGTRVASLIGALTNNGQGVAGSSWNTLLLPVRVLGKCGGRDSDIIAGMRWAAGLAVTGAPLNPTPAHIINLSLGGQGACSAAYQAAISEIVSKGVLVVVSVGNESGPVGEPANCANVIGVSALRHAGTKVGFSNLGPETVIGAPGGNCVNAAGQACLYSIVSATDEGRTTALMSSYTDQTDVNVGTSFSAPLVSGAAALLHSLNTTLTPRQYRALLQESASPFPTSSPTATAVCHVPTGSTDTQGTECICTTQTCGAGMLNTHAAVLAAQLPLAVLEAAGNITANTDASIDARSSFAPSGRSITAYQWSVTNVSGTTPVVANTSQALTTLHVTGASTFTLRVTVTDDQGGQDSDEKIIVATAPAPPPPPVNPGTGGNNVGVGGGGGGGGGSPSALFLGLASLFLLRRRSPRTTWQALPASPPDRPGTR